MDEKNAPKGRAQVAPETILIGSVMMFFLLSVYLVNIHIEDNWNHLKGSLEASSVASRMASQINQVAQGGSGTSYYVFNSAPPSITNMTIFSSRALRVYYEYGGYVSVPLATNKIIILDQSYVPIPGEPIVIATSIPLNKDLIINNLGGTIFIRVVS